MPLTPTQREEIREKWRLLADNYRSFKMYYPGIEDIADWWIELLDQELANRDAEFGEMVKKVIAYEESRKKGHLHPKWNESKKDSLITLNNLLSLLTPQE